MGHVSHSNKNGTCKCWKHSQIPNDKPNRTRFIASHYHTVVRYSDKRFIATNERNPDMTTQLNPMCDTCVFAGHTNSGSYCKKNLSAIKPHHTCEHHQPPNKEKDMKEETKQTAVAEILELLASKELSVVDVQDILNRSKFVAKKLADKIPFNLVETQTKPSSNQ